MTVQVESADCWLARLRRGRGSRGGRAEGCAALKGMKWGMLEGGRGCEEEGRGSSMVWLGTADGMKAEAFACAAAEALFMSRPTKLALEQAQRAIWDLLCEYVQLRTAYVCIVTSRRPRTAMCGALCER